MAEKLDFSLILCEFDEHLGPIPRLSYPEINKDFAFKIAQRTIDYISDEEFAAAKSVAFLPFPTKNKKAIARNFEWDDEKLRGGKGTASIVLIFDESDDLIYYKYIKDLEFVFDESTEELIKLKSSKAEETLLLQKLKDIHINFTNRLKELCEHEINIYDSTEAFPDENIVDDIKDFAFKVVVCGDPACGKTSTILRFTDRAFRRTYLPTMGVNITAKDIVIDNKKIHLVLWDLAGQIKFQALRRQLYEGARGIILLYDITRSDTFKSIPNWYNDIKSQLNKPERLIALLCGNKSDLKDNRKVSNEEAEELADQLNINYLETSALTGENIDNMFRIVSKKLMEVYEMLTSS